MALHFPKFSKKDISFISQLFKNGRIVSWVNLKSSCKWTNDMFFFQWAQLKHAIPVRWKKPIFNYSDINDSHFYQNHHVIKGARILSLGKLSSKEIGSILILNIFKKQKQPPKVFFKKRCSQKFRKIHRKTPVPEPLFK